MTETTAHPQGEKEYLSSRPRGQDADPVWPLIEPLLQLRVATGPRRWSCTLLHTRLGSQG